MIKTLERILKNYATAVEAADQKYQVKKQYATQNYKGELLNEQLKNIKSELDASVYSNKEIAYKAVSETIGRLNSKIDSMVVSDPGKLAELQHLQGMKLTASEFDSLTKVYKDNYMCLKFLANLADVNGLHFDYTSTDDMIETVEYLDSTAKKFIHDYDGSKDTYSYNIAYVTQQERPFQPYEAVFNDSGAIEITVKPRPEPTPEQLKTLKTLFDGYADLEARREELKKIGLQDVDNLCADYFSAVGEGLIE